MRLLFVMAVSAFQFNLRLQQLFLECVSSHHRVHHVLGALNYKIVYFEINAVVSSRHYSKGNSIHM